MTTQNGESFPITEGTYDSAYTMQFFGEEDMNVFPDVIKFVRDGDIITGVGEEDDDSVTMTLQIDTASDNPVRGTWQENKYDAPSTFGGPVEFVATSPDRLVGYWSMTDITGTKVEAGGTWVLSRAMGDTAVKHSN